MDKLCLEYPRPPPTLPYEVYTWLLGHNERIDRLKKQWIYFGREYYRQKACGRHYMGEEEQEGGRGLLIIREARTIGS